MLGGLFGWGTPARGLSNLRLLSHWSLLLFVVFIIIVLVLVVLGFLKGSGSVPSLIGLLSVNDLEITVDLVWLLKIVSLDFLRLLGIHRNLIKKMRLFKDNN